MFFDKQTSDGNNLPRNYENSIPMPTARNPVQDESYYQKYNPDVISYIEERIPFLTKNIGGFDESLELKDISLLNTKWSFGVRRNFDTLKITFYDMYVQDKDGIMEWVCVSELFKTWIDNIFYNKVDKNKYNTYGTVLNYFNNYAIPKLEVLQFSNRLEVGDIMEYMRPLKDSEYRGNIRIVDALGYWDKLMNDPDNLVAKYLNDLQYDRLKGGWRKNIIGIIASVLKPINDVINMVGVTSNFTMNLADGFENYNEKELNIDDWKRKRTENQENEVEEARKFKALEKEIAETSFKLFEEYKEIYKNKLKPYDIVVTDADALELGRGSGFTLVPTEIKRQQPKNDMLDEILIGGEQYFKDRMPPSDTVTKDLMDIFDEVLDEKPTTDGEASFVPQKELSKNAFKKAIEDARFAPRPAMFGQEDSARVFSYLAEALAYVSVAYSIVDIAKIVMNKVYPESKISPDWYASKYKDVLRLSGGDKALALGLQRYIGDRFIPIKFKDNSIIALIDFLIRNENDLKNGNPEKGLMGHKLLFNLPINEIILGNLQEDERFKKSNITDEDFIQNISDENHSGELQELNINPIKTFVFYDIYPIGIAYESLDSENENLTTFTVTFKYTHFEQK
jgi:hypothetical protein